MKTLINLFFAIIALLSVVILLPLGLLFSRNILRYRRPINFGELWLQILPFNGNEKLPFLDVVYYWR